MKRQERVKRKKLAKRQKLVEEKKVARELARAAWKSRDRLIPIRNNDETQPELPN